MAEPQLRSRASKLSLFHLFDAPNVEKARGYAEQGLKVLRPKQSRLQLGTQKLPVEPVDGLPPRSTTSMSLRGTAPRPVSRATARETPARTKRRGATGWESLPLYQAHAQATKEGTLEVGSLSTGTVLQKSKSRRDFGRWMNAPSSPRHSGEDRVSMETRRTTRTTTKHISNGSITRLAAPQKVFVLVKSGGLLQYAESGPNDRLPERILQLGKDSAAFACDLIPGRHYVLQISESINQQGMVVARPSTLLMKLGLRKPVTDENTSSFLLVMPDAADMDDWMIATRLVIESMGGHRARPDTAERPKTRDVKNEPTSDVAQSPPMPPLRSPIEAEPRKMSLASRPSLERMNAMPPPEREYDDVSEIDSIDALEQELNDMVRDSPVSPEEELEKQFPPDATQSARSSGALSFDQQRLNSLRNSQRISHSTVGTSATSPTAHSASGSPPTANPIKASSESVREHVPSSTGYRTLSSYSSGRRRSAMPLSGGTEAPLPAIDVNAAVNMHSPYALSMESPVVGRNSPHPLPKPRKLAVATSAPNLRAVAEDVKAKHDSRMSPHLPSQSIAEEKAERPLSIIGDLPHPSMWSGSNKSPVQRLSGEQSPIPSSPNAFRANAAKFTSQQQRTSEPYRPPKRYSSQTFSLPLKIIPSTPENRPPTRTEHREPSFNEVEQGNGEPVVHTLTAKVDTGDTANGDFEAANRRGGLPFYPAHISTQISGHHQRKHPTSATTPSSQYQSHQPNGHTLRRPASVQMRPGAAPPIRSLKPSRSALTLSSMAAQPLQQIHPALREKALPPVPPPTRPQSRTSNGRRIQTQASLSEMDVGVSVAGLGPPAPPPQQPLPVPPGMEGEGSAAGLGIRV
ncbi:hypothetical protein BAUCODRAFT_489494 [Baudoinia panamericana UAMH 10762]|uniref:PH domain-containing protein n=1 Tax=Baudoinia panamericana (strain UAMH 10762) TaxID=717646 RepID=M2MJB2_BAUPA|nr:uncharacterized protein BAUCODRAFT_489494 [Baudoinia panamericana UAMH 10762]EMC96771.1 hypothetical protein BAUCODRAFT_489494 [Baudoinia panamericana UAMH 10762]